MKKIFIIFSLFLTLSPVTVYAATPTPKLTKTTPTPTQKVDVSQKLDQQINELKEKIASRVSELNLVEKRGVIGIVSDISGSQITLKDVNNNVQFVDVDEITKFSSASNKTFGLSDIKKGTRLSVLGLYNKQSTRILARFVDTTVDPTFVSGTISDLDKTNFYITIITLDKKQVKIDVETSTKINSYTKADGVTRYGFSKLAIGDRVTAIGYLDKKDATMVVADRVIDYIDLPKNPHISVSEPAPTDTDTPTPSVKTKSKTQTPATP